MAKSILTSTFIRFRERLRGVAAGITHDDCEAEDILHDAFCKLWAAHIDIDNELSALRMSYAAVRNSAIDSFRRKRSHPTVPVEWVPEGSLPRQQDTDETDKKEICDMVLLTSRKILKEKYYRVFFMHDVEGLSYDEIASSLELSQENVRTILSRARKMIREYYRKNS